MASAVLRRLAGPRLPGHAGALTGGLGPRVHPLAPALAASLQQVRHGPKDGRPGRLQHHIFGCDKAKGRYYYRFHKLIGKWNWRKYTEHYMAPRSLENRQRWIPTTWAGLNVMKNSHAWHWLLPKALAAATTSDEVLEAWIKFRHKHPKKTFHYFKVLSRLAEVGGCDASDWRLRVITSRMQFRHRKTLNLPRLAKYYAQLKCVDKLEDLGRFLKPMVEKYSPGQLVLILHAYGTARVQEKHIFEQVAKVLEPQLAELTPSDLVRTAEALAAVEVCHYTLLTSLSSQLQVRIQQASEGPSPSWTCPTFDQLTLVAAAFARLKFQDYSYFELCTGQADELLRAGLPGPTPVALARLCSACSQLKIHEIRFFEIVLAHISAHWYDYPALALAEIGAAVAPSLPRDSAEVQAVYSTMIRAIAADCDNLSLHGVALAARFMAEVDHKGEFYPGFSSVLSKRIWQLRDDTKEVYEVGRVMEIFSRRCPEETRLFSTLCRHLHRHLPRLEPVDFVRFVRGLAATEYRDGRVVHALAKWAGKRAAEFSKHDWEYFVATLAELKGAQGEVLKERLQRSGPFLPEAQAQAQVTA